MENSGKESTESIELQQFMAEEFVKRQKDMKLFGAYVDNGFTRSDARRLAYACAFVGTGFHACPCRF